jgi:ABC-2 type transport system ATP-binding protein
VIDRRTWLPVVIAVAVVGAIVGLIVLGRSDVEVEALTVSVPDGADRLDLDVAVYRPGAASADDPRPAVLLAHGFLGDRSGLDARARALADEGFVVMTWSARGFGASGGEVGLADPDAEVADVSRLLDVLAERPEVQLDAPGDPRVAIVGGSYGAGTALLAATEEPRLDAVVAAAGWHSLSRSLAPNGASDGAPGVLKAGWTSLLFTANALPDEAFAPAGGDTPPPDPPPEVEGSPGNGPSSVADGPSGALVADDAGLDPCGRFSEEICTVYLEVAREGVLTDTARAVLDARSPAGRLDRVTAPTLLLQGQDDTLFDLTESRRAGREIAAAGTPVRLRWLAGGHEVVGGAGTDESREEIDAWLDRWLRDGDAPDRGPFSWTDQAADATRDRDAPPARPTAAGGAVSGSLAFELAGDGRLVETERTGDAGAGDRGANGADSRAVDERRPVTVYSPPGGQPAALSSLPGASGLVGFLPATDIPGQHVAFTSPPMTSDTTLLGPPQLSLQVLASGADDASGPEDPPGSTLGDGGEVRVFVKLSDVAADGNATLIQQGVMPVRATSLPTELTIELSDLAYRLRDGHRLRVTVATTDQGFANRTDGAATRLAFGDGASELRLPVVASVTTGSVWPVAVGVLVAVTLVAVGLLRSRRRGNVARAGTDASTAHLGDPATTATSPMADVEVRDPPPIVIRGLTKRYGDGHLAVDGLDLTVGHGQVMGLLGPNGAGKTTSLRMLLGLSTPTAGDIRVLGHDMRPGHPVLGRVGALVEGPGFVPELSGIDNLQLYWRAGGRRSLDEADLPWALGIADLGAALRKPVRTYSHGMKQRLAIAQALLGRPELLVLDEPTDGLDPEQIRAMRELLARLGGEGHTVLVSSHLLAEVEQMCTHVAVVQRGRLLASGSIGELVGTGRTVVVETDDRDRARTVLARHLTPGSIEASGAGLAVTLGGHEPADLVTWLVGDGLRIQALTPRGKLEDAFLSLTGEPRSAPTPETAGGDA